MVHIHYQQTAKGGRDINLPPSITHRSGGNTIILVPGQSNIITGQEWDYIRSKHADVCRQITIIDTQSL